MGKKIDTLNGRISLCFNKILGAYNNTFICIITLYYKIIITFSFFRWDPDFQKNKNLSPVWCGLVSHLSSGWCGLVDWASACKRKGWWFDSKSGHMPGLCARSPVRGVREAKDSCFCPFLSLFFPLSKNK